MAALQFSVFLHFISSSPFSSLVFPGNQFKAINAFMGSFLLVSAVSWIFCRQDQRAEQERMKKLIDQLKMRQELERKMAAQAAAAKEASKGN